MIFMKIKTDMFHGLTMVKFDGQVQNQLMVKPWLTVVDHVVGLTI